jgi:hypothetical protein
VSSSRPIRIPRSRPTESGGALASAGSSDSARSAGSSTEVDRRRNQAGLERARRLTAIYVGTLAVLYVVFVALDRSAAGGSTSAVDTGLISFTVIAAAIGALGAFVALSPAPRAIEIRPDSVTVVEWWGHRRTFPPVAELTVSVLRRYPSSFLSSRDVESLEIGTRARGRKTYQFEVGLFPKPPERAVNVSA